MGWFGRKSVSEGRGLVPSFLLGNDAGAGFARGYAAQYDEVFRRNPVGQRCVRLVAGMIGGLPVYDGGGRGEAVALVMREGLLEQVAAGLLLHGNAYVQLIADARDRPAELHSLRPERVSVATDAAGWPAAYLYRAGAAATRVTRKDALGRRQVAHLRFLNPGDDHYGLGCLDAAIGAASVHNRAATWNKALLDNAARPSGALMYEPGDGSGLGAEQYERLKRELTEQFSGSPNAGRPLLLEGGLKWQALSLTPADMDFAALKEGAARDIALAFGVPPAVPVAGLLYRVASGASGEFSGHDGALAAWSVAGWRFFQPVDGLRLVDRVTGIELLHRGGAWSEGSTRANEVVIGGAKVVVARQPAIADASGGAVIDVAARAGPRKS